MLDWDDARQFRERVAERQRLVGIDSSAAMLEVARRRAEEAGCASRVELINADLNDQLAAVPIVTPAS